MELTTAIQHFVAWIIRELNSLIGLVFSRDHLVQLPAIFLTLFIATSAVRVLDTQIRAVLRKVAVDDFQEAFYLRHVLPLIAPLSWVLGLWLSRIVAQDQGWPSNLVLIAINLASAWLIIRFAAALIPQPTISRLVALAAWAIAALNILDLLTPAMLALRGASFSLGGVRVSLLTVLGALLTLVVLLWVTTLVARATETRLAREERLSPAARVLFVKLIKFVLILVALVISLAAAGIDVTALAVFTGALGVGIGFGLQKIVANLFAGIIILLDKSIKPGDIIQVGDHFGWVSYLGARYIAVETRDGTEFLIPNDDIITHQVFNWTHQNERVRLKLPVRVALDADVRKALALMREAASRAPRVLATPVPNPLLIGIGENGLNLELRFWISDAQNGIHNVSSEVLIEIVTLFRENGIVIPLPQRVVRMEAASTGATLSPPADDVIPDERRPTAL